MLRHIDSAAENDEAICLNTLCQLFSTLLKRQDIKRVLNLVRISKGEGTAYSRWEGSTEKQLDALAKVLPRDVQLKYCRQINRPAHNRGHEKEIVSRLGPDQQPICMITTSIDHAARNEARLSQLRSTLTENGHIAILLLWDWQTDVTANRCPARHLAASGPL